MANNPLYPGYSPRKEEDLPPNPMYPGYYTGQPLPKRRFSKNYIRPIEYQGDVLEKHLDRTINQVSEDVTGLPKRVVDTVLNDFKESLRVSIAPTFVNVVELDDYNLDDLPGPSGVYMSLNPLDYIGEDKKAHTSKFRTQTSKTLKDWFNKTTGVNPDNVLASDYSDIENKVRAEAWRTALGYQKLKEIPLTTESGEAIAERISSIRGFKPTGTEINPLNLRGYDIGARRVKTDWDGNTIYTKDKGGNDVPAYHPKEKDIFKGVAHAVANFEEVAESPRSRDIRHDDFLKAAVSAANKEIQAKYDFGLSGQILGAGGAPVKVENTQDVKNALEKYSGAVSMFGLKNDLLQDIGNVSKKIENNVKQYDKNVSIGVGKSLDFSNKQELRKVVDASKSKMDTRLAQAEKLLNQGKISSDAYESLKLYSDKYKNLINKIDGPLNNAISNKIGDAALIQSLRSITNVRGGDGLTGGDIYRHGLERQLLKNMELDMILPKAHKNAKGQVVADQIGMMFRDDNLKDLGINIESSKLAPITYKMRQDRVQYAVREFLDSWDRGRLVENYLWNNRIRPRIERYLPSYYATQFLKSRNYFGLNVTEEGMERLKRRAETSNFYKRRYENAIARYAFKVKMGFDKAFSSKWGTKKAVQLEGGDHFGIFSNTKFRLDDKHPSDYRKFPSQFNLNNAEDKKLLVELLATKNFTGYKIDENGKFELDALGKKIKVGDINILDGKLSQKLFELSRKNISYENGTAQALNSFKEDFQNFNQWYKDNAEKMFGEIAKDATFRFELFVMMFKKNASLPLSYKLNKKYIGGFQKLHMKMEQIQAKILGSKFAKYIGMVQNWKDIVGNKVATLVSQAIAKLLDSAAAASGVAIVAIPVIEAAVKFTVKKMLTYGETLLRAMTKGDFKDLQKLLDKEAAKAIKAFMYLIMIVSLPWVIVVFLFFGVFNGSVSPVDQSAGIPTIICTENSYGSLTINPLNVTHTDSPYFTVHFAPATVSGATNLSIYGATYAYSVVAFNTDMTNQNADAEIVPLEQSPEWNLENNPLNEYTTDPIDISTTGIPSTRIAFLGMLTIHLPIVEGITGESASRCYEHVIVREVIFNHSGTIGSASGYPSPCDGYETNTTLACPVN